MNTRKYKLMEDALAFVYIKWCDWCDTLCMKPHEQESEMICRHCVDDASTCEICDNLVHPDLSVDMPEGWYCQDCWESVYE